MNKVKVALLLLLISISIIFVACDKDVEFTVNFEVDGEIYHEIDTKTKETITLPANPTRAGYNFAGWYVDKDVGEQPFTAQWLVDNPPTENITVYAKWDLDSFTITFDSNGGSAAAAITKLFSEAITAPNEPTKDGYTFEGWYTDNQTFLNEYTFTTMPAENLTLYAKWDLDSFTITFDSNGGSAVAAITKLFSEAITAPDEPTKDGYTFEGWYTDNQTFLNEYTFTAMPSQSLTLYSKWDLDSVAITFNSNGGSAVAAITKLFSEAITAPDEPTKDGYTFEGWYTDNQTFLNEYTFSTMPSQSLTLYAKWDIVTYSITYHDTENQNNSNPTGYTVESDTINLLPLSDREGFNFVGWQLVDGTAISEIVIGSTGDIDLYAAWIAIDYDINYHDTKNQNNSNPASYTVESDTINLLPLADREGYNFGGWQLVDGTAISEIVSGSTGNIDLYAAWVTIDYDINYHDTENQNNPNLTGYTVESDTINLLPLSDREGYNFGGWQLADGTAVREIVSGSTGDIDLYAIWLETTEGLSYELLDDGESYQVTGIGTGIGDIVIPSIYNGKPVVQIGEYAFAWCCNLEKVIIGENVTSIGEGAFAWCESLEEIIIGENVTTIGDFAFNYCENLISIIIPNSVISIGDYAFADCYSLEEIIIGENVATIGGYAFAGCYKLEEIIIGENVATIGGYAFAGCYKLEEVIIGENVATIGGYAFAGCYSLEEIIIGENVASIGEGAFDNCESLTSIEVLESNSYYKSIDGVLFNKSGTVLIQYPIGKDDTSYNIPIAVTSIGDYAFAWCYDLEEVFVGKNVTIIGEMAFYSCYNLTIYAEFYRAPIGWHFNWNYSNLPVEWRVAIVFDSNGGSDVDVIAIPFGEEITAPDEPIKDGYAFDGWYTDNYTFQNAYIFTTMPDERIILYAKWAGDLFYKLINNEMEYEVTGIGNVSVSDIVIPSTYRGKLVTSVGDHAFFNNAYITSIVIPNGVTSIGYSAFGYCYNLATITIPESVAYIGDDAFSQTPWEDNLPNGLVYAGKVLYKYVGDMPTDTCIDIAEGTAMIYQKAFLEHSNLISITIPSSVTSIGFWAFSGCSNLVSVIIPDSVTSIGEYAFAFCTSLEEVTLGENVTIIGKEAFYYCEALTSINIPNSVTLIGDYTFSDCYSLEEVVIGENVTSIGDYAFAWCYDLEEVIIGENVASIGKYAFAYCRSLKEIIIGENITSIGEEAFKHCNSLASIEVSEANSYYKSIDDVLFGKDGLTLIQYPAKKEGTLYTVPNSVIAIRAGAFEYSQTLASIIIGDSVTLIGNSAFSDCYSLKEITIGKNVTTIGGYAFAWCYNLEEVFIGENITIIGDRAFYSCVNITIYAEVDSPPDGWHSDWNPNDRPVEWGVVVSIRFNSNGGSDVDAIAVSFGEEITAPDEPTKYGYAFDGWYTDNYTFQNAYTFTTMPDERITLYAKWKGDFLYRLINNETEYEIYNIGNVSVSDIVIPSTHRGKLVTSVGDHAFFNNAHITSVVIPDGVTSIGYSAFGYCYNLATITIPESVAYIGDDAFSQTPWEDNLPNGLVYVGKVLYRYVGDMPINTHLDIAEGTASIYHYAFDEAYDLLSVTIPSSLTLIGQSAFNYCTELYFIFIPNSVEDIGAYAFYNCKNLTIYTEASAKPDGWVIVGNSDPAIIWGVSLSDIATITFNSNGGREVLPIIDITGSDLSEPVAPIKLGFTFAGWYIDNQTFENKYEFVTMPSENLTLHAKWTEGMTDTEGLTYSLTNGDTEYMVTGSLFVESMDIVIPSTYNGKPVTGIAPSAFEFRPITSVFIPDSVTFIGSSAFKFCYMLATVFIGQGVSDIGDYAFTYCNNLSTINVDENNMHYKSIDGVLFTKDGATLIQYPISKREVSYQIPMGTTKIATNAFGNSILKYITIPDGVEEIADSAFAHCDNLQSLTIPSSVISIGVSVLQNCHRLTVINVDENNAYYKSIDGVLFSKDGATLIHYPIKKTGISYQIPMGTTKIAANAFEYSILESITIPEGVEEIGNMAFMDCYLLQSLTIPSSVTSLGVEICARNTSLTAINVDENNMHYKSIDGVLFTKDGATLIYYPISKTDTIYTIPSGVSKIVSRAFNFCSYLTSVTIPSSVTQIESYAFYHCLHLTIYAEFTAQPIGWDVYWNNSITALEWQVAIVFDSNGGSEVTTITAFAGKSLDAPDDPTQEGYSFDGWYTDNETFLNAYTFTTMPGESLTLYARWLRE